MVKRLSTTWDTWVPSLGWEDSLAKEMSTHSSTLALKIPRTEELGAGYYPWGRKESGTTFSSSHFSSSLAVTGMYFNCSVCKLCLQKFNLIKLNFWCWVLLLKTFNLFLKCNQILFCSNGLHYCRTFRLKFKYSPKIQYF